MEAPEPQFNAKEKNSDHQLHAPAGDCIGCCAFALCCADGPAGPGTGTMLWILKNLECLTMFPCSPASFFQ